MGCVLCGVVKEEFRLVKEGKYSFCVVCLEPLKKGHLMVLPKRHVTNLSDLDSKEAKDLLDFVFEIKEILFKKYNHHPILHMNFGKHSTQEHIHFHLVPSKGNLRDSMGSFENLRKRKKGSQMYLKKIRDYILEE